MSIPFTIMISDGKEEYLYEIVYGTRKMKNKGWCYKPNIKGRGKIKIKPGLSSDVEADTIVHEILHAACWNLSEEVVNETATTIIEALVKSGAIQCCS